MTVAELKSKAKELKIAGYSKMKKADLEAAIQRAEKPVVVVVEEKPVVDGKTYTIGSDHPGTLEDVQRRISSMSKGEARRYRKSLFQQGFRAHAAVRRIPAQVHNKAA